MGAQSNPLNLNPRPWLRASAFMHSQIAAIANHHRSSVNPIGDALANGPGSRLRFRLFEPAGCHPVKSRTNSSFQRANSDWVVVV